MTMARLRQILSKNSYLFALILLIVALGINYSFQDNLFETRVLNRNIRNFLPLIILVVGQAIVIIGGGIDLSVGAMVSMCNAILVTQITSESTGIQIAVAIVIMCIAGMAAGAFNGLAVAYLRLQPIVTTYATGFIYAGIALYVLPRPGGDIPRDLTNAYRQPIGDIPVAFFVMGILLLIWWLVRETRFAQYLYAAGDDPQSAYTTGIPVSRVKLGTYVISGLFAALAALALTLSLGSGSPRIGDAMTLDSIVAVVLGGTRLRGGQGGIFGAMMGVIILGVVRNIISFANVPTWSQTLVDALIILGALAASGGIQLVAQYIREFNFRRGATSS